MKKFIALALAAVMLLSLAACGGESGTTTVAPTDKPAETTKVPATTKAPDEGTKAPAETTAQGGSSDAAWETKGLPAIPANCASGKVFITSVGQSADANAVNNLFKKAKWSDYYEDDLVTAANLSGGYNVLIVAVGGSTKGLGSAGLDEDKEVARATALLAKAHELKMTVIFVHIGGTDRRGNLSDRFIDLVAPEADYAIVLAKGDTDNHMHDVLAKKNTPTAYVEKVNDTRDVLAYMLGK